MHLRLAKGMIYKQSLQNIIFSSLWHFYFCLFDFLTFRLNFRLFDLFGYYQDPTSTWEYSTFWGLVVMKSRSVFIAHLVSWFYVWVWVLQGWCRGEHQNSILLPIFKYSMGEQGWNICLLIWSTRRLFYTIVEEQCWVFIRNIPGFLIWFDLMS